MNYLNYYADLSRPNVMVAISSPLCHLKIDLFGLLFLKIKAMFGLFFKGAAFRIHKDGNLASMMGCQKVLIWDRSSQFLDCTLHLTRQLRR